jgi:hypothetical protein
MKEPTSNEPQNVASIRRKYLRWSIPSLVLAVVCAVFTVASSSSKKQITQRYDSIISDYVASADAIDSEAGIQEMRRAEIAAKRLVVENPNSTNAVLQSARVNLASYAKLNAGIASKKDTDPGGIAKLNELALGARSRAMQSMQRAAKRDGKAALEARLWISEWRFRSSQGKLLSSEDEHKELVRECEDLLARGAPASLLVADVLIHDALRFPMQESWDQTIEQIQRAQSILASDTSVSIDRTATHAEILSITDLKQSRALAAGAVAQSVRDEKDSSLSWRDREALFRCRLFLGNPQEAFDFAWRSFSELPPLERDIFRWNAAASSIRGLIVQFRQPDQNAERNVAMLLGFALRIAPDAPQIVHAIDLLWEPGEGARKSPWDAIVDTGHDRNLSQWVGAMRRWLKEDSLSQSGTASESYPEAIDRTLIPCSVVAIRRMRQRGMIDASKQLRMLDWLISSDANNADLLRMREYLATASSDSPPKDTPNITHP